MRSRGRMLELISTSWPNWALDLRPDRGCPAQCTAGGLLSCNAINREVGARAQRTVVHCHSFTPPPSLVRSRGCATAMGSLPPPLPDADTAPLERHCSAFSSLIVAGSAQPPLTNQRRTTPTTVWTRTTSSLSFSVETVTHTHNRLHPLDPILADPISLSTRW
jgi:hypothetical protein